MKVVKVSEILMKQIEVKIGKTPAGYSAAIDILPGWIVAVTGSFADIRKEIEDSIAFYIECAQRDGEPYPKVFNSKYELIYKFDVESLLYCYDKIISKAALSRLTGINEKQLSRYGLGLSKPRPRQADKIVEGLHILGKDLLAVSI